MAKRLECLCHCFSIFLSALDFLVNVALEPFYSLKSLGVPGDGV
jgi:hypothetical protein